MRTCAIAAGFTSQNALAVKPGFDRTVLRVIPAGWRRFTALIKAR